jgi:fido (protein-threonine AMPylation protein)
VELVAPLNRIGVEPVLLKGAIRRVDGLYPEIGWRMMRDLDVLISEGSLAEAVEVLRGIGYDSEQRAIDPLEKDWRARHPDRPALVEVHRELFGGRKTATASAGS